MGLHWQLNTPARTPESAHAVSLNWVPIEKDRPSRYQVAGGTRKLDGYPSLFRPTGVHHPLGMPQTTCASAVKNEIL